VGILGKVLNTVLSTVRVSQRTRHAEVDQERTTRLEPNNQILATAIDLRHVLALELSRDLDPVVWARQAGVADLDVHEPAALQRRRKPAADGLDLGQLGHSRTVPLAPAVSGPFGTGRRFGDGTLEVDRPPAASAPRAGTGV
jgi:hypothetical protein